MLIYEGEYTWNGNRTSYDRPISWWPGSYNLKIVDISFPYENVYMFKPVVCMFSSIDKGVISTNCIQNLAKKICKEFKLKLNRVLWIEKFPTESEYMEVVLFKKITSIGSENLYGIKRRPVMVNELKIINDYYPDEIKCISSKFSYLSQ